MWRKRKLDAALPEETTAASSESTTGGFWGGSAMNMLKARLEEAQAGQGEAILAGLMAIELDPAQIVDEIGSDRRDGWRDDPDFAALVADMKRRGQKQPVRVRPLDPDWCPAGQAPFAAGARFALQSGRRRLAAMVELGRPVMAVIATEAGDARLADMEERFLENTMRRDLSGFEELLSIGLLAQAHGDLTQAEIAQRLGVPPGDVSLGLSCVELAPRIQLAVDVATTPKRAYRTLIPQLRSTDRMPHTTAKNREARNDAVTMKGGIRVAGKLRKSGAMLEISGHKMDPLFLRQLSDRILEALLDARDGVGE